MPNSSALESWIADRAADWRWVADWTSRLVRRGKARVSAEMATIFERLHIDAARWQQTMTLLCGGQKLIGAFAGGSTQLSQVAKRNGTAWVKHRGTRVVMLSG